MNEKRKEYQREYYKKHKNDKWGENKKGLYKKWVKNNPEYHKKYREKHKEKLAKYHRDWYRKDLEKNRKKSRMTYHKLKEKRAKMTEKEKELGVKQYATKPNIKKAMYFDGSADSVQKVRQWLGKACLDVHYAQQIAEHAGHSIKVGTLEGPHIASPGDYIIQGLKGEFYPCKPDVFKKSYQIHTKEQQNETT